MPRDWQLRIEDILDSIARIHRYLEGMGEAGFIEDERTMDAAVISGPGGPEIGKAILALR